MPLQENLVVNKKDNRVFMSRNHRSDGCYWKFDVLKTRICALEASLLGQIGHFTVVNFKLPGHECKRSWRWPCFETDLSAFLMQMQGS